MLSKENGRAPQSSFDFATILVVRRKMDPHARSFSFVRERARTNPIPDDLVVSDSDLESIGNLDTTTKLVASRSHGRPRKGPVKQTSTKGSIIELSDDSSRQPSIPGIIELSGQPTNCPQRVAIFDIYYCFQMIRIVKTGQFLPFLCLSLVSGWLRPCQLCL